VAVIFATSGSSSSAPAWQPVAGLPTPLEGSGVAAYRGQVWIAGGCSNPTGGGCSHIHDVELVYHYNPQTGQWQHGPPLPAPVNHPAMVSDGEHLFVVGGFGGDGQAVASVFRLDSPSGTWQTDSPPLPAPRGGGAAAWDGKRIVFAGGAVGGGVQAQGDIWALGGDGWNSIGQLQKARSHLAGASDGHGTVWFVGGKDAAGQPSPLVDAVSESGVTSGPPVSAVTGNTAVAVGSGFCTLTGKTGSGLTGAVQCRPSQSLPALDPPRDYSGAAVLDGNLYVVGGYDAGHNGGLQTVESLAVGHLH
jgi:N-acetylneuraminic acid mutarotase